MGVHVEANGHAAFGLTGRRILHFENRLRQKALVGLVELLVIDEFGVRPDRVCNKSYRSDVIIRLIDPLWLV